MLFLNKNYVSYKIVWTCQTLHEVHSCVPNAYILLLYLTKWTIRVLHELYFNIHFVYEYSTTCWHWDNCTYYCLKLRTANRLCTNNYLTISLYTFLTCVRTILGFTLCSANFAISRVLAFLPRVYAKIIHLLKFADTVIINNFDTEKKIQTREIHYNNFMCSTIV